LRDVTSSHNRNCWPPQQWRREIPSVYTAAGVAHPGLLPRSVSRP